VSQHSFDQVNVLVVDSDLSALEGIRMILRNNRFGCVHTGGNLADIKKQIELTSPDLLIANADLPDGSLSSLVHDIRHHKIGTDPFLPVIAVTANPDETLVHRIADSGADDLLIKPLSTLQLLDRVETLVEQRKPFVVTCDYVGPDRRKSDSRPTTVPMLEVPNSLKVKVTRGSSSQLQTEIRAMIDEINEQKLDRHVNQINWLADALTNEFADHGRSAILYEHLDRMVIVAEDATRRIVGTRHSHILDLCESLISVVTRIRSEAGRISGGLDAVERDLKLLHPLGEAIKAGFTTGVETTAHTIADTVR
jgi:DNA-binding response OmpR family regulator